MSIIVIMKLIVNTGSAAIGGADAQKNGRAAEQFTI